MPIKFRCPHCRQFLGISRSKAGEIADCPTCGKRLRVPNLDGTIAPLPKPELDLQDSSLVSALGELASIGTETAPNENLDSGSNPASGREAPPPAPLPEPVALDPLVPAKPVAVADPPRKPKQRRTSQETAASLAKDEATIDDPELPLPDFPSREAFLTKPKPARRREGMPAWVPVTAVVGLFLIGGTALVMLMSGKDPSGAAAANDGTAESDGDTSVPVVEAPDDNAAALAGRITYVSEAGDTRPDDGARVIALPKERRGTVLLDTAGLLVGSAEVDTQVATASVRALGGDVATANVQGEYELHLRESGEYHLLVISRHQSRPWEIGVESDVQDLLARFLIRPSTLLGQLAYDVQSIHYRGHGSSLRDVAFERP